MLKLDKAVHQARQWLHARYIRAVVTGLYVSLSLCSVTAIALEIRHDVSLRAIVAYFGRDYLKEADLGPWIRHHETARALESIWSPESRVNPGGLVYAEGSSLRFYPHVTHEARATRGQQLENLEVFPRLVGLYHSGQIGPLLAELDSADLADSLRERGGDPAQIAEMRQQLASGAIDDAGRVRMLRRAAGQVSRFVPYVKDPYHLPFGEELRFYDSQRPAGDFVGVFEIHGGMLPGFVDEEYARSMSRYSHYIVVFSRGDGALLLEDHYRGEKRQYRIEPLSHPGGLELRRVLEIS